MSQDTADDDRPRIGYDHPTVRPTNWEEVEGDLPAGEAYIQFEDGTSQAFRDLVRETLETSEFIETEYVGEQLVVREV